jgi:uncharacterized membrane protein YgcG
MRTPSIPSIKIFSITIPSVNPKLLSCGIMITAFLLSASPASAASLSLSDISRTFTFGKNLRQGDTVAPDVSYLQYILNQSADTQVAATGSGSLENLTNYFGAKTQVSVLKFQEKYRSEILTPANLAVPTGFVGEKTRAKLNQILAAIFNGTFISTAGTPSASSLLPQAGATGTSANNSAGSVSFANGVNAGGGTSITAPGSANAPVISSFSTFKALSGQLMSLFGARFHPTANTVYLGSQNVGVYASQDNGTKITFTVPPTLDTGSYEVGVVNAYGTTSTGYTYLAVTKQAVSSTTPAISFTPTLTTLYPNTSTNINDLVFLYGDNFSFNNTLETNLGNTIVRSTNRKTLSFMIGELPYYSDAFKKYKGQSINVLIKLRNENGLSSEQLVHVIQFPNSDTPTVNTSLQEAPPSFNVGSSSDDALNMAYLRQGDATDAANASTSGTSSSSGGAGGGSGDSGGGSKSGGMSDPSSMLDSMKPPADPLLEKLREISPVHKFLTDPLVKGGSNPISSITGGGSGGSSGSGGGGAAAGIGAGIGLGAAGGGGSGGSGGSSGGGAMINFGGTINSAIFCSCSAGFPTLLSIRDVRGGTFQVMYQPGVSSLKEGYSIWVPGVSTLGGMYSGGQACMLVGTPCTSAGTAQYTVDFIRGIGSSVTPAK